MMTNGAEMSPRFSTAALAVLFAIIVACGIVAGYAYLHRATGPYPAVAGAISAVCLVLVLVIRARRR